VHVRGNEISLTGDVGQVDAAARLIGELLTMVQSGHEIGPVDVASSARILDSGDGQSPSEVLGQPILTSRGRSIRPKTLGQKEYVDAIDQNTIVFGIGPAGTGKTYLAMAKAVQALQRKEVERIILTRPAVEAGERLGFLPGTLTDKIDPYLRPLYDALNEMMDPEIVPKLLAAGTVEVAPLAYMRGRTLNNSFIVLDEAQNTTPEQMKMFLTRLGFGSHMVVTGDVTQVDLPTAASGLRLVTRVLADIDDIHFSRLTSADVVRHSLVGRIVDAYTEFDARRQAQHYEREQAREFANRSERRAGMPHDRLPKRGR
jgi:phosphate starvation-inducible PhoH-like protein